MASAQIPFEGKVYTLAQLAPFKEDPDDGRRLAAWEAEGQWYRDHGEELDTLYDRLVQVRDKMGRALGFDGYNEMKIALAKATATAMPVSLKLEPGVDTQTLCTHAYNTAIEALNGTRSALDPESVDRAATLLQRARQVFFFGQGGSYILACDIWARFSMLSTKFRTAGDSHMQAIAASLMGPEDVVVFVSYSGATRDMMDTLHLARENGAKVILLTHYSDAPGAALADVVLLCGAKESPLDSGSMPVKLAVLFVANVLVLRYTLDNQELANLSLSRTSRALGSKLL